MRLSALMIIAGSAPLQWRIMFCFNTHERHWSAALPAMSGPGGPRPGESLTSSCLTSVMHVLGEAQNKRH